MNRAQLIQRLAAHEAAARALRDALEAEARAELEENGTAPSWKLPDGSRVTVRVSAGGLVVTDEDAFVEWARTRYPGEIVEETIRRFRNDGFRRRLIGEWERLVFESGASEPPFLGRTSVGQYRSTSVVIAPATKERMEASALAYVLAGETMPELGA